MPKVLPDWARRCSTKTELWASVDEERMLGETAGGQAQRCIHQLHHNCVVFSERAVLDTFATALLYSVSGATWLCATSTPLSLSGWDARSLISQAWL